jgi:hypothetical protein
LGSQKRARREVITGAHRIGRGKSLQPGEIQCECEFAVADGYRAPRIKVFLANIVALDECLAVNGRGFGPLGQGALLSSVIVHIQNY